MRMMHRWTGVRALTHHITWIAATAWLVGCGDGANESSTSAVGGSAGEASDGIAASATGTGGTNVSTTDAGGTTSQTTGTTSSATSAGGTTSSTTDAGGSSGTTAGGSGGVTTTATTAGSGGTPPISPCEEFECI